MKIVASGAAVTATAATALWALRHHTSTAVNRWSPPSLAGNSDGPLYARCGGDGRRAVVLLHGLVSSGDVFGAPYDRLAVAHRVVIPDLLGFGRSLDETRASFTVEEHLDALDQLAHRTGLFERRWTIGAHSMGSALALHWAARHPERVERVMCWGAPIYPSPAAAQKRISGSAMTRLFVLDTRWAERACAISCRHRSAAGWLTAVVQPSLPIPVARAVSLHTWPAFRDAMRHLVITTDWRQLLGEVADHGIPIGLTYGTCDLVGGHAHAMSRAIPGVTVTLIPGAGHHLPMSQPELCMAQITPKHDGTHEG